MRDNPYIAKAKKIDWVPVSMLMPPAMTDVLVVMMDQEYGQRWITIAGWIPEHSVLAEDFLSDESDPDDSDWKDDLEYVPQGWWELCGDEYRKNVFTVTHWMFKPELPKES